MRPSSLLRNLFANLLHRPPGLRRRIRRRESVGPVEALERRCLLSNTILGSIWDDQNADGNRDVGEPGLPGRTVYLDANNNDQLDAGELSAITDANGDYAFNALPDGTYYVKQIQPDGWRQSFPQIGSAGSALVSLTSQRDMVYDLQRDLLYITMSNGTLQRYDLATGTLLPEFAVGTFLNGADITPDGSALYVAENDRTGVLYKVDTEDGSTVELTYSTNFLETGSYDVAIGSGDKGLFSLRHAGSGPVQLREFDLATDAIVQRRQVRQDTQLHRSADRSTFFLTESNTTAGPILTYDAVADTFSSPANTSTILGSVLSAVNRDGSRIATEVGGLSIMDSDFNAVENLTGVVSAQFDPVKDVLYALDAVNDQVVAFDTHTWDELLRFDIGEDLSAATTPFGSGTTQISADGRFLFLSTSSGVRIYDLVEQAGGRVVTIAGSSTSSNIDFATFDPPTPQISIDAVTVAEGNSGPTTATFTVSLSAPGVLMVSVQYQTADDSATLLDGDYLSASGTLNFAPGETTKTVAVQMNGDTVDEFDERFLLTLYRAVNANIADGKGVGTIANDDSGPRGVIRGTTFGDANGDGVQDGDEAGLSGWSVYIDQNNNGQFDDGEPSTLTDPNGHYALTNLPIGQTYTVTQVPQNGWEQTSPVRNVGVAPQRLTIPVPDARDLVYDPVRELLYITTADGKLERYDMNESRLLAPFGVGNSLYGADITPDGSALYIAEGLRNAVQSMFRKVNLPEGSVTNLVFDHDHLFSDAGAWDVAIGPRFTALLTGAGSNWVPLRELDLTNDSLSIRTPNPGSGFNNQVRHNTHIYSGVDRSKFLFAESDISSDPLFTYDAIADAFLGQRNLSTGFTLIGSLGSVSRDGLLVAIESGTDHIAVFNPDLNPITTLSGLTGGLLFDPAHDILYAVDSDTDELVAIDTNTFNELYRAAIGEPVSTSTPFSSGVMAASPDGRQLFLSVRDGSGPGKVLMFRLIVDSHTVTLNDSVVDGIDFGNHLPDLSGFHIIDGKASQVLQLNNVITFVNEHGNASTGYFATSTQVVAEDWGNLVGNLVGDEIQWANGTVWGRVPDLTPTGTINGDSPVLVQQLGIELKLTNEHGGESDGRFINSSEIVAEDWGDLMGTVVGDMIQWANGSVWTAADPADGAEVNVSGAWAIDGEDTSVLQLGDALLFINERGEAAQGMIIDSTHVVANGWGDLGGTIDPATRRIFWDNGTVWNRIPVLDRNENWHTDEGLPTAVSQLGVRVLITNEFGDRSEGRFDPFQGIVATDFRVIGEIDYDAPAILWDIPFRWNNSSFGARDEAFADLNNWPWLV